MKLHILKILLPGLIIVLNCGPICLAQAAAGDETAAQTTTVLSEDERLPFMQPEGPTLNNEPGSGGMMVRTIGAMILIVGLIFFGAWGLRKMGFGNLKNGAAADVPDLTILSSVSLGSGRTISTVRFGERVLLVGSTAQSFTLLADQSENEKLSRAEPRSVAEMLAEEEENSFAAKLSHAELTLAAGPLTGAQSQ